MSPRRHLHLNAFLRSEGHHESSWRHPDTHPERALDIDHFIGLARTAERGLFDSLFLADSLAGTWKNKLEPLTLLSALSTATTHVGLIATVNTTYNEPFHVARKLASLDHISRGRAGWNIVTGADSAEANFGRERHPEHDVRYASAEEFVDVVTQLWDSWEDDAPTYDKAAGVELDASRIHEIDHRGRYFSVKGPLNIARPPQGYPVLVQAGSSESGKEFAAKIAEMIFTAQPDITEAQIFYHDVKSRLAKYGRTSDQLAVLPGLSPILAETDAEAEEMAHELDRFVDIDDAVRRLSGRFGVDLSLYPLDGPVPFEAVKTLDEVNASRSRFQLILDLARRERLTIRQLAQKVAKARGHVTFVGTPSRLADLIEEWFVNDACDGFNLMPQLYPSGLDMFVDHVVPELQNRGLFRTAYEGTTLRDSLGLLRPANVRHQIPAVRR